MQPASPVFEPKVKEELRKCFRRIMQIMDPEFADSFKRCSNLIDKVDEMAVEEEEIFALIEEVREVIKSGGSIDEERSTELMEEIESAAKEIIQDEQVERIQKIEEDQYKRSDKSSVQQISSEGDKKPIGDEICFSQIPSRVDPDVDLLECLEIMKYLQISLLLFTNTFFSLLVKQIDLFCTKNEYNEGNREELVANITNKSPSDENREQESHDNGVCFPKDDYRERLEDIETDIKIIRKMLKSVLMNSSCLCQTTIDRPGKDALVSPSDTRKEEVEKDKPPVQPVEECPDQNSLETFLYVAKCYHPEYFPCIEKCVRALENVEADIDRIAKQAPTAVGDIATPVTGKEEVDVADENPEALATPENKEIKTELTEELDRAEEEAEKGIKSTVKDPDGPDTIQY